MPYFRGPIGPARHDHTARFPLDIIFLVERLESLIATGTGVPATRKVLVDRDAVLELIDQLRVAIPEEVQAAKRINAEGERILETAHEEFDPDREPGPGAGGVPDQRARPCRRSRRGSAPHHRRGGVGRA